MHARHCAALGARRPVRRTAWLSAHRADCAAHIRCTCRTTCDVCSPYGIVRAVGELVPDDCIVTTDVGQHQMWVAQAFPFRTSGSLAHLRRSRARWASACRRRSAPRWRIAGATRLLHGRWEPAHEHPGARDARGARSQREDHRARQRRAGPRAPAAGIVLRSAPGRIACIKTPRTSSRSRMHSAFRGRSRAQRRAKNCVANAIASDGPHSIRVPIAAEHHVLPMVAPGKANVEAIDYAASC